VVLIAVSFMTPAPAKEKLAGLTFATVDQKLHASLDAAAPTLAKETVMEHRLNVFFSCLLLATVIGLWIYFR
jgi:hypothetical protein